jgi:SAM-dependent methyltransferase
MKLNFSTPPIAARLCPTDEAYWRQESLLYSQPHRRLRLVARLINRSDRTRLLDVGCGPATLRTLLRPDIAYYGSDLIGHARPLLDDRFEAQDFNRTCDLSAFADQAIDIVHVGGLLEYLQYPGQLLGEIRRVAPAALLVVTMVNFASHRFRDPASHHPRWIYKPTLPAFFDLLASAAWTVRRAYPYADRLRGWRGWTWHLQRWLRPTAPFVWLNSRQVIVVAEADRSAMPRMPRSGGTAAGSVPSRSGAGQEVPGHSVTA